MTIDELTFAPIIDIVISIIPLIRELSKRTLVVTTKTNLTHLRNKKIKDKDIRSIYVLIKNQSPKKGEFYYRRCVDEYTFVLELVRSLFSLADL